MTSHPLLSSRRRAAQSGNASSMVVFLHGYGADGADLISLGETLAPHLPDTVFHAPDAPEPCRVNPMGRQWFPIPWIDGSSLEEAEASMGRAVAGLSDWLSTTIAAEGVEDQRVILLGFSQGSMMALHHAPRRVPALGGVVGFSGKLLVPERLAGEAVTRLPVLLVHGDRDDVVPVASLEEAAGALRAASFPVLTHISEGVGHGIAPDGLGMALGFIQEALAQKGAS